MTLAATICVVVVSEIAVVVLDRTEVLAGRVNVVLIVKRVVSVSVEVVKSRRARWRPIRERLATAVLAGMQ
jgi:hypothetical protein